MAKNTVEIRWSRAEKSGKPAYIEIADYCIQKISSGEWPAGSFLPSQRDLALKLDVNRSTIIAALDELKAIGMIETHGKGGTKVAKLQRVIPNFSQPNWQSYIDEGLHKSNFDAIQIINRSEFSSDLIRLSSGEASPDLFPSSTMSQILSDVGASMKNLGYEEPKGMPGLREEICRYLQQFNIQASPSCVLIVSGALQAIQLISLGLLQPGSSVFLERPSYLYSLNIFQSVGVRRCGIGLDSEGLCVDEILRHKQKHRQSLLYTIPNFHNPTGIVMSESRRLELIQLCSREQIPIVEDDVYRELWMDQMPPAPLKSMDQSGTVLYTGSVSKTLSPGLRIGWIVGPESVMDRLSDIKMQTDYGSSSISQLVVEKWLSSGAYNEHSAHVREQLRLRRHTAIMALERYFSELADWDIPTGGFYVWIRFRYPIKTQQLFEDAFKQGILTYPGFLYDSSMNHCLRISYSYATLAEIELGIRKLSEIALKHISLKLFRTP